MDSIASAFVALFWLAQGSPAQDPVLVAGRDVPHPKKVQQRAPVYPDIAQAARVRGVMLLEITLDTEGRPTNIKILRAIPLLDAAAIDGGNELDIFVRIMLPLTRPALAALTILQFLASWNMFMWPLIITTSSEMRTIQVALTLFTDRYGTSNWGLTMAGSAIALLPMLLVYVALQKQFVQGITMSGMKF